MLKLFFFPFIDLPKTYSDNVVFNHESFLMEVHQTIKELGQIRDALISSNKPL